MNMVRYTQRKVVHRRGMALLLVMIALVVCSVMTAGYLATQNTAIGLTKNQAASDMARQLASSGIDCALYYLNNNDGWSATDYNTNWRLLADKNTSNKTLIDNDFFAGAHVTVKLAPVSPATAFSTDATAAADLVSTGTYGGQSVTITTRIQPTGAGNPWGLGIYAMGALSLTGPSVVLDSYKSGGSGPYVYSYLSQLLVRYNATVGSVNSITIDGSTQYWNTSGVYQNGYGINARNGGKLYVGYNISLPMKRVGGWVTPPNINSFSDLPTFSSSASSYTVADGNYPASFNVTTSGYVPSGDPGSFLGRMLTMSGSGTIYIPYNMAIKAGTTLRIANSSNVVLYVAGNIDIAGRIIVDSGSTLTIYATNEVIIERYAKVNTDAYDSNYNQATQNRSASGPSALKIFGLSSCPKVQLEDHAWMSGLIFAPQSLVQLTCDSSCTATTAVTLFGSVVGNQVNILGASRLHQDLDASSATAANITGGTYAGQYEERQSW